MSDDPTQAPGLRLGATLGSGAVATVLRVASTDGRVFAGKRLHDSHGQDGTAALADLRAQVEALEEVQAGS